MSIVLNMAYPAPFLRLVASGTMFGVERFSYGMSFMDDFGGGTVPTEVPAGVISALSTLHANSRFGAQTKLDEIKVNLIGTDGRYVSDTTVVHDIAAPVAGTGSLLAPAQIATVVSLETGARRGLAARGRFYLPANSWSPEADGRLNASNVETFTTAVKTALDAIEDALPGWDLCVASKVGAGRFRPVTSIRIGRTLDTIRSRRASLPEMYPTSTAYNPD